MTSYASERDGFGLSTTEEALLRGFLQSRWGAQVEIASAEPLGTRSRNRLLRLRLHGAPAGAEKTLVVKHSQRRHDPFFAHHMRREERVLDLLARFAPGFAPQCHGMLLDASMQGWLLMEDVGDVSLARALEASPPSTAEDLLNQAAELTGRLHALLRAHRLPFYRTCFAVELDRLTAETLEQRYRVAWRRLSELVGRNDRPPTTVTDAWRSACAELLAAPRQMIHNSLSPLNMVVRRDQRLCVVDWETMTFGSCWLDWAELLRQPFHPLTWDATERLAGAFGEDRRFLSLAAALRDLDDAGGNARQYLALDPSTPERSAIARRLVWYCSDLRALIADKPQLRPLSALLLAAIEWARELPS